MMKRVYPILLFVLLSPAYVAAQRGYADRQLAMALLERNDLAVSARYRRDLAKGDSSKLQDFASSQFRLHQYKSSFDHYRLAHEKRQITKPKQATEFVQLARMLDSAQAETFSTYYKSVLSSAGYADIAQARSTFRYAIATAECFNSDADDFGISLVGNMLLFASSKGKEERNIQNSLVKTYKLADQTSCTPEEFKNDNEWYPLLGKYSDKLNCGPVFVCKDKSKIFITGNQSKADASGVYQTTILESHRDKNSATGYSELKSIPAASTTHSVQHPYYDDRSGYLYFSSNMPGGEGGYDIYKVKFDGETWGKPENLSDANTAATEAFPSVDGYGNLYYAGRTATGFGGLDILRIDNNKTIPVLLEAPINSPYDDFNLVITDTKHGYFTSNRKAEKGGDNIYSYRIKLPDYRVVLKIKDQDGLFPIRDVSIKGKFQQAIYKLPMKYPDTTHTGISDDSGEYVVSFPGDMEGTSWKININMEKKGYINRPTTATFGFGEERNIIIEKLIKKEEAVVAPAAPTVVEEVKKVAPKIRVGVDLGKLLNLKPIYFDVGKSDIRPDAAVELDKIVYAMNELPNLVIELGAHTDSRGQAKDNLTLSQLRAESSGKYILSQGIDPRRLSWSGYGESKPLNKCKDGVKCKDAEYAVNRRTEFRIVKM